MYLPYDDRGKPEGVAEYLEIRRLIEERIRRGDERSPVEIYDEFALVTGAMKGQEQ